MISLISYVFFLSFGIISSRFFSALLGLSAVSFLGGNSYTFAGKKDKNFFICLKASSSFSAILSVTPFFLCTSEPPSSSFVKSFPKALETTAGPATKI